MNGTKCSYCLGREEIDSAKIGVWSSDGSQCKLHIHSFQVPYNCIMHLLKGSRTTVVILGKTVALVYEFRGESTA